MLVELEGELDLATRGTLDAALRPLAQAGKALVLDVSRLRFCSTEGLELLVELADDVRAAGGSLTVQEPNAELRRLLAVTGMHKVMLVDGQPEQPPQEPGPAPGEEPPCREGGAC